MSATALLELLSERVSADPTLERHVSRLILAACRGESALLEALHGETASAHRESTASADVGRDVFLTGIRVGGFRGIGPDVDLPLTPGPGLTVVTGRNGSGKSSFAEAVEMALTGGNSRWASASAVWKEGWRNLHRPAETHVGVRVVRAGQDGITAVRRRWSADDRLDGGRWTEEDDEREEPFDSAAWRAPLETYRPFLPYSDLGKLITGDPKVLFDALHRLLGLEVLSEAQELLRRRRLDTAKDATAVRDQRKQLREELATIDDERARRGAALLNSSRPSLDAIAALAISSGDDGGSSVALRQICELELPGADQVRACADDLIAADEAFAATATRTARTAAENSRLLTAALHLHRSTGTTPCPVCEVGVLDDTWHETAVSRADELRAVADEFERARVARDTAFARLRVLCTPPPPVLRIDTTDLPTGPATSAWQLWHECASIDDATGLRTLLRERHRALVTALAELQARAHQQLAHLDLVWRPLATKLLEWHGRAEQVAKDAPLLKDVTAAENWLKNTAAQLRAERIAPFAAKSQEIWHDLRQQSNIDLDAISLTGTRTGSRRVDLNVSVDGVQNAALAVMSQGELHALALALFLPRATVDESPFRFVVIDDPVQAMDAAKVDGLAQVLSKVAADRQVVVFTHDERLSEAVRRLQLPATVWEVRRGERSVVTLRRSDGPVERYLDDARALHRTEDLPTDLKSELITSFCRSALEAASHTKVRRVRLARGVPHHEVDAALAEAHRTTRKVALAVFDDATREPLLPEALTTLGPWAQPALHNCRRGAHIGFQGDLGALIRDVGRLADWIQR